ncbi:MAG: RnfABCDGE type electron transport complex subunit B [Clostridia bacterium]|nr:RnfABCDGE type electron transport complex subunit B [Clostridia bacterium]
MDFMAILTAFLVVAGVGLVLGVLLALFTHFFGIEDDPKFKAVRGALPGANCGACGFKGCDDYAKAIAEGRAAPNLCIPGGADTVSALSEILGVEAEAAAPRVAFVHCNGVPEATSPKAAYDGMQSCCAECMVYGGAGSCVYGCIGCGDCASVCPADAICIRDGIAHIDPRACIGCGACAKACPKHIISMIPKDAVVANFCSNKEKGADARKNCKNACIGCKKCEKTCPNGAITVIDNNAIVDYEKCTHCGACAEACPTKCLKAVNFQ